MKKILLAGLVSAVVASTNVVAAEDGAGVYLGLKVGQFRSGISQLDDDTAVGFQVGYDFGNSFAIELEHNTGEMDLATYYTDVSFDVDTTALYAVFRSEGDFYFKGKVGVVREEISTSVYGSSISEDDSGGSYGIGGGYRNGAVSIEAEYTWIEEDLDIFGLGLSYHF